MRLCDMNHKDVEPGLKLIGFKGGKGVVVEKEYDGRFGPDDPLIYIQWDNDPYKIPSSWWLHGFTAVTVDNTPAV